MFEHESVGKKKKVKSKKRVFKLCNRFIIRVVFQTSLESCSEVTFNTLYHKKYFPSGRHRRHYLTFIFLCINMFNHVIFVFVFINKKVRISISRYLDPILKTWKLEKIRKRWWCDDVGDLRGGPILKSWNLETWITGQSFFQIFANHFRSHFPIFSDQLFWFISDT